MVKGICPFATDITGKVRPWNGSTGAYSPGGNRLVGFCDHTAGGYYGTLANPDFWNAQGYSVHFGISQQGQVVQVVNIFDRAYGQGRLGSPVSWPPYEYLKKTNPNELLISTEHEDKQVTNYQWSPEMYAADLAVKKWCVEEGRKYGFDLLQFGLDSLAGHFMFDPQNRAYCPGSGWPRDRLYKDLIGAGGEEGSMANINADGSKRVVEEGNFIVTYNNNIPVLRVGSTDGRFPGRMSKNFGGNWLWFRTLDDNGGLVAPYWSQVEGD